MAKTISSYLRGVNYGTLPASSGGTGVTTSTGSGSNVLSISPTLVTPLLGTPTSGVLTNCTGYAYANLTGAPTVPVGTIVGTTDTQTVTNKTLTTVALYETKVAMSANDINLSLGNYFTKTISAATTLTVSNVPAAGTACSFILDLTNGGSGNITWWTSKWVGGTAPSLTVSGRDTLGFFTHDGGTTWSGFVVGKDLK